MELRDKSRNKQNISIRFRLYPKFPILNVILLHCSPIVLQVVCFRQIIVSHVFVLEVVLILVRRQSLYPCVLFEHLLIHYCLFWVVFQKGLFYFLVCVLN